MSTLLIGFLGALLALETTAEVKPAPTPPAASASSQSATDPVEREYEKILADDDAAQAEADKWIKEAEAFRAKGAPLSEASLNARIEQRFAPVKRAYEDFLQRHPDYTDARLAYGSFLCESGEEDAGVAQWEKARQIDPKNPASWNNLANHYGHRGPVKKAFEYYEKAIQLKPDEPVYIWNLATTLYVFRKDAKEYYNIDEKTVFDRSLELYRKAMKLDPKNFPLATDYAQSFYGIQPLRTKDALSAWDNALKLTSDEFEREGVYIHLARVELNSGMYPEARQHLGMVTNKFYHVVQDRLSRNLEEKMKKAVANPPASVDTKSSVEQK